MMMIKPLTPLCADYLHKKNINNTTKIHKANEDNLFTLLLSQEIEKFSRKDGVNMKGYDTQEGYMGFNPETRNYQLFATYTDYVEWYQTEMEVKL